MNIKLITPAISKNISLQAILAVILYFTLASIETLLFKLLTGSPPGTLAKGLLLLLAWGLSCLIVVLAVYKHRKVKNYTYHWLPPILALVIIQGLVVMSAYGVNEMTADRWVALAVTSCIFYGLDRLMRTIAFNAVSHKQLKAELK